jgi:hypothetical protein
MADLPVPQIWSHRLPRTASVGGTPVASQFTSFYGNAYGWYTRRRVFATLLSYDDHRQVKLLGDGATVVVVPAH